MTTIEIKFPVDWDSEAIANWLDLHQVGIANFDPITNTAFVKVHDACVTVIRGAS